MIVTCELDLPPSKYYPNISRVSKGNFLPAIILVTGYFDFLYCLNLSTSSDCVKLNSGVRKITDKDGVVTVTTLDDKQYQVH